MFIYSKFLTLDRTYNLPKYFNRLLPGRSQISLHRHVQFNFSPEIQHFVLGTITITPSNLDPTLDLIGLAHQCTLTDLEVAIGQKLKPLLNHKNICSVLNTANLYNLAELRDACHLFMDQNASEILNNDCFKKLSQVKPE